MGVDCTTHHLPAYMVLDEVQHHRLLTHTVAIVPATASGSKKNNTYVFFFLLVTGETTK